MRTENMTTRAGNKAANQFILYADDDTVYFKSYESIIAKRTIDGKVTLDPVYWDYSVTTRRYRVKFLCEHGGITQAKIDSGEYELANLN